MPNPDGKGGFQNHPENINLEGRPAGSKSITTLLREKLTDDELVQLLIDKCKKGDTKVLLHVFDHIDGKAIMKQIVAQEEEEPFVILHKYKDKNNGKD